MRPHHCIHFSGAKCLKFHWGHFLQWYKGQRVSYDGIVAALLFVYVGVIVVGVVGLVIVMVLVLTVVLVVG